MVWNQWRFSITITTIIILLLLFTSKVLLFRHSEFKQKTSLTFSNITAEIFIIPYSEYQITWQIEKSKCIRSNIGFGVKPNTHHSLWYGMTGVSVYSSFISLLKMLCVQYVWSVCVREALPQSNFCCNFPWSCCYPCRFFPYILKCHIYVMRKVLY